MSKKQKQKNKIGDVRYIVSSIREYKKYALLTPFFMVFEAASESAIPFVMTLLIEKMRVSANITGFLLEIIILFALGVLSIISGILGGTFAAKASTGLAKNLREDLYKKLQSFSFANIDKFSSSSLVTRMTTDVNNAQQSFQMCIRIVIRAPLLFIFSVIMAFMTGGTMAFIFISLIPIIGVAMIFIIKSTMKIFKRVFKRYDALNASVEENVRGIRVVKSYVKEDYEKEKFNNASNSMSLDFIKAEKTLALINPVMNTSIHTSNLFIIMIGSYLILSNSPYVENGEIIYQSLSPEKLSALITYGVQILSSLIMVAGVISMLAMSMESIHRIAEVLKEQSTIVNPIDPIYEVKDGAVEFDNVSFKYSSQASKNALENINIKIESGQFIGIIGSTGSGKTSLVNLISRLYDVSEGSVKVGGEDVKNYDLKTLRDNVAVILQKNVLFSGTIESNLKWGDINASEEEMVEACKIAQADEFIQSFKDKYQTHIEQGGANVSGGQKQRLCIARAILKKPKILILDDSTSAVDTKTDRLIRKGLKEMIPNTTKIVIAQRISSIEDADQIIVMDNGQISMIGNHEYLLKNSEIYQEVYYSQNKEEGGNK
ncbi:MAG: ABC transporter ATP-binding protein [Bacilli bacterium]